MELPTVVPVMTLPSATLFPQALLPLYIFEPRYRQMLADALRTDRMFSVAMQKPGRVRETPCTVAGLGLIRVSVGHNDGTSHLILQGLTRVELKDPVQYKPYRMHSIRPLQSPPANGIAIGGLVDKVLDLARQRLEAGALPFPLPLVKNAGPGQLPAGQAQGFSPQEVLDYLESLKDADQVADLVSCALLPGPEERQTILATVNTEQRLKHLVHFLMAEVERNRNNNHS